jgi:uncharacterized delta-60 repeat protein
LDNTFRTIFMGAAGSGGVGSYWIALVGTTDDEYGYGVAVDSADNIVVCALGPKVGDGSFGAGAVKLDADGLVLWGKTATAGTGTEVSNGVAVDSADNIIATGYTTSIGAGSPDYLTIKRNSSGTIQWSVLLGGSGNDQGYAIAVDSTDNIIVSGPTYSDGAGSADVLVAKYNSSGALQWDKTLGGTGSDSGGGVAVDSGDNIVVCGLTAAGASDGGMLVAKYNSSGTLQWDKALGDTSTTSGNGVAVDSADNIIAVGVHSSDVIVAKFNSSGTVQWSRTLGGDGYDTANSVAVDSADNIIVVGSGSTGAGGNDMLIAKYNSSGTLQWDKTLGGTENDFGQSVAIDSGDNIVVCGYTLSDGAGGNDILIARLPPDGSGDGTYGSLTYQDASLTSVNPSLTASNASLTDSGASLTSASASLTDASVSLTEELFPI